MKNIILSLVVLVCLLPSCMNQEEIGISYQTKVSVTAAEIFDSFQPVQPTDFDMMDGWNIHLRSFVYNEEGSMICKSESLFNSLDSHLDYDLYVGPGKYTIISVANFEGSRDGVFYNYWGITGESNIRTFTITENSQVMTWIYETLGVQVTEIVIEDSTKDVDIHIPPVTALIQVQAHYDDIIGDGYDGYSKYTPTCTEFKIMAETRTQTVKVNDKHELIYGYVDRSSSFPVCAWEPNIVYEQRKALTSLAYRAFLPENNVTFKWSWIHNLGGIIYTEESTNTIPVNFESGKQYDMDLVLDILYLFVEKHDPQRDWEDRVHDLANKQ